MWKLLALTLLGLCVSTHGLTEHDFTCKGKLDGIYVNPSDCASFLMCSGGHKTKQNCPAPLLFSPRLSVCDWANNVECQVQEEPEVTEGTVTTKKDDKFDCHDLPNGPYPNKEDCTTFFECSNGDVFLFKCPHPLIYNPRFFICDWPSESNTCQSGVTTPVPTTAEPTTKTTEKPTEAPTEPPTEKPTEPPTEPPTEKPTEKPTEPPTEPPTEKPTEKPTEPPTEPPSEPPTEKPTEPPTEKPTEPPTEKPTEPPTEKPTEKPTEPPTEPPTEKPTEKPTEPPTEPPTQAPTEPPTEKPTEPPTEPPTEKPTEPPTEKPTEPATQAPTEPSTEKPTEPPTEAPTEKPTEAPTEAPTEKPTEPPTEEPTTVAGPTTPKPKFCKDKPNGLYPHETSCTSYYKCTNTFTFLIHCPTGNYFDPKNSVCVADASVCLP